MYREYALEPAVLFTWDQVRFFLSHVGPWCGRFIARYPKTWKRMVYDGLSNCGEVERKRIEERLRQLDDRVFTPRTGAPYDAAQPWVANALDEHTRHPFAAIIARSGTAGVVDAADIGDHHPDWTDDHSELIKRTPQDFAAALAMLLKYAKRMLVIDPYFRADQADKRDTLVAFVALLPPTAAVEVHAGERDVKAHHLRSVANDYLPARLPAGMSLTLRIWQQRIGGPRLHNRYLLTEIGGVQFGDGVESGNPGETDRISILKEATRLELWSHFVDPATAFDPIDPPLTITGTGRRRP